MAKTSSATASKWWKSISVTRNSNGSYSISSWWRTVSAANASSARQAISSMANSSWGKWWWSVSSWWGSGWSSGWSSYSSGSNTVASSVNKPTVTQNINGTNFGFSKNADGTYNVYANGKYSTVWADSEMGKAASKYLGSSGSSNSSNNNTVSTNTGNYTKNSFNNYTNAMQHYISQGMTQDEADKKARSFLEEDPTYISKSTEEKDAEMYWPTEDEDMNEQTINDITDDDTNWNYQDEDWYDDVYRYIDEKMDPAINSVQDTLDRLNTNNTESNVIDNKAEVSKDPIFDYNTYFKENLSWDQNVWETGEVKPEAPTPNTPLTDVTKYQDDAISALQNLWFLEPNTEAAESIPGAEEQTAPETLVEDTPEALVQWFDEKMDELGQMWWEQWLTPQAVAQTYVDYKNRLAKYIKNNNIPDDQAAAMFDQLKNNEKLRNFLQANRR